MSSSVRAAQTLIKLLIRAHCIDNGKKIWWDVRVHHIFDTVEVRICDMPTNMDHTVAVVALVQALMAKLYLMHRATWLARPTRGASSRRTSGARPALRHRRQAHRMASA